LAWQLVQGRGASSCGAWQVVHGPCAAAASTGRSRWHEVQAATWAAPNLWGWWQPMQVGWPALCAAAGMWRGPLSAWWQRAQPLSAANPVSWTLWQSMQPRRPAWTVSRSA
jgi:hypothetical protein